MNALAHLRPERMPGTTFSAWRVTGGGISVPIEITGDTLAEVVNVAAPRCMHKEQLAVLEERAGKRAVHFYQIKQGTSTWVRKEGFAHAVQIKPLKPVHLFSMNVEEFVPVEPWRWTPGCDPVGLTEAQRNTVEAR